ncbi:MAG: MFS transporter, partial [Rikenellaceae bacterium]
LIFRESQPKYSRIDIRGLLLLWGWIPLTIVILTYLDRWSAWIIGGLTIIVILIFMRFVNHSLRSPNPIINVKLLTNRRFALSMISMFFDGFMIYAGAFILPLYLEKSLGYSALAAGLMFIPLGIIQGITSPASGYISRRLGMKTTILTGFSLMIIYLVISTQFDNTTASWVILLSLYLRGLGNGLSYSVLNNLSLTQISHKDLAGASSISNATRQLSGLFGIAICTLILSSQSTDYNHLVKMSFSVVLLAAIGAIIPIFFVRIKK